MLRLGPGQLRNTFPNFFGHSGVPRPALVKVLSGLIGIEFHQSLVVLPTDSLPLGFDSPQFFLGGLEPLLRCDPFLL